MVDGKAVIIGSIISAGLTIAFSLAFFPLFILGPILGGFVTIYLVSNDKLEGVTNGALSGVIGGLILGLLALFGIGVLSALVGIIFETLGSISILIGGFFGILFTIIAILICGVLGAVGGAVGEMAVKETQD